MRRSKPVLMSVTDSDAAIRGFDSDTALYLLKHGLILRMEEVSNFSLAELQLQGTD